MKWGEHFWRAEKVKEVDEDFLVIQQFYNRHLPPKLTTSDKGLFQISGFSGI